MSQQASELATEADLTHEQMIQKAERRRNNLLSKLVVIEKKKIKGVQDNIEKRDTVSQL